MMSLGVQAGADVRGRGGFRRRAPWVLGLFVIAQVLVLAGNASATIVGYQRVVVASASSSAAKGATASCPAGTKVLGSGVDANPGNGDVLVDAIRPDTTLASTFVHAVEDQNGTTASWTVSAYAICASPPSGVVRVGATSATNSTAKTVVATCPSGKQVVGTGAEITGAPGQVLLSQIRPNSALTAVTAGAIEDQDGTTATWSVTAYAVCADPIPMLKLVVTASASDSSAPKTQFAPCPNELLIGMGGIVTSSSGQIVIDDLFPDASLTTAGFGAWEDDSGTSGNWSLTTLAICAAQSQRISVSLGPDTAD